MSETEVEGFEISLHGALSEPVTLGGVPRTLAIVNGTLTALLCLGLQAPYLGLPLGAVIHALCYWLNRRDPYVFEALARHLRQRPYWDA